MIERPLNFDSDDLPDLEQGEKSLEEWVNCALNDAENDEADETWLAQAPGSRAQCHHAGQHGRCKRSAQAENYWEGDDYFCAAHSVAHSHPMCEGRGFFGEGSTCGGCTK